MAAADLAAALRTAAWPAAELASAEAAASRCRCQTAAVGSALALTEVAACPDETPARSKALITCSRSFASSLIETVDLFRHCNAVKHYVSTKPIFRPQAAGLFNSHLGS